jgi:type I restriction enzyme M protein
MKAPAMVSRLPDVAARGYNLDLKNPHQAESISHDPDALLMAYADQQRAIQSIRDQLKGILAEALGKGA